MPVTISTSSAGEASLRLTSRLRWCTNGRYFASSLSASGKPTASANVAPRPTTAALMCSQSEIEYRVKTASMLADTIAPAGRLRSRAARRGRDQPVGAGARSSSSAVPMPQVTPIDGSPCALGGDDVERAVADHHRPRRAELLAAPGRASRVLSSARVRRGRGRRRPRSARAGPSRSSSGSAKRVRLGGGDREPVAVQRLERLAGCRAAPSSRSASRSRSARGSRRCRRRRSARRVPRPAARRTRRRTAGRCRAAAPRRPVAGGRACRTRS